MLLFDTLLDHSNEMFLLLFLLKRFPNLDWEKSSMSNKVCYQSYWNPYYATHMKPIASGLCVLHGQTPRCYADIKTYQIKLWSAFTWRHSGHVGEANKETAAILEEWNIILGIKLYFYANLSFCFIMKKWLPVTWANTLYTKPNWWCQSVISVTFIMIFPFRTFPALIMHCFRKGF